MRKAILSLTSFSLLAALIACGPRTVAPVTAPADAPTGRTAADNPTTASPAGAVSQMLLKAGFAVPKSDVTATDFSLQSLEGKKVSLSSYKGQLVFLSFWATWCGPCKQELPSVQALYEKLKAKGFVILAVDVMEDRKTVSDFVKANAMTFPVLLDASGAVGREYEAGSIPTNYLLDRNGKILARIVGYDGTEWTDPARIALFEKLLSL
jgi:thiol-disulfide isomerase/thioredoxin